MDRHPVHVPAAPIQEELQKATLSVTLNTLCRYQGVKFRCKMTRLTRLFIRLCLD
jgi:hypothetical protein